MGSQSSYIQGCFCLMGKKVWDKLLAILNTGLEMLDFIFEIFVELFSHDEYLEIIVFFVISFICNIVI